MTTEAFSAVDITKTFPGVRALSNVSIRLQPGQACTRPIPVSCALPESPLCCVTFTMPMPMASRWYTKNAT
jgi:hypothetical protein